MSFPLFLDSTRRNRAQWPNPAEFDVPNVFKCLDENIQDPILTGAPIQSGNVVASTNNSIRLAVNASTVNDAYNSQYVKLTSGPGSGQFARIIDYDGATRIATIGTSWQPPIGTGPAVGVSYEVYKGIDNYNPIIHSSALKMKPAHYQVCLEHLCIPNDPQFQSISFLFVYFTSTALQTNSNFMMTNNERINTATFMIPITDHEILAPFLQLHHSPFSRTIYINPDDTIYFRLSYINGQTVTIPDTKSPNEPNPLQQIGAVFTLQEIPAAP